MKSKSEGAAAIRPAEGRRDNRDGWWSRLEEDHGRTNDDQERPRTTTTELIIFFKCAAAQYVWQGGTVNITDCDEPH